jgi:hypothetical protein
MVMVLLVLCCGVCCSALAREGHGDGAIWGVALFTGHKKKKKEEEEEEEERTLNPKP